MDFDDVDGADAIKRVRNRVADFLAGNPNSDLVWRKSEVRIVRPWNDDSLEIRIPEDEIELMDALQQIVLPERFTAIWHSDTRRLEVIFTAYPLPADFTDLYDRKFTMKFEKLNYSCEFAASSDRLLALARNYIRVGPSSSAYRNMPSYRDAIRSQEESTNPIPNARPISFWIDGLVWNDDLVLTVVNHLNFYMPYFDKSSPPIIVHSPRLENSVKTSQKRLPFDKFPNIIIAKQIPSELLQLHAAAREGDPFRRFIYCYQILEYSAYLHIKDTAKRQLRRILSDPDVLDHVDNLVERISEASAIAHADEANRLTHLLEDAVDPDRIWREIELNPEPFYTETKFDGGYVVKAMMSAKCDQADFRRVFKLSFGHTVRGIRNGLSHGQWALTGVIFPTTANFRRLQPWLSPMTAVAREVMQFRHL